MGVGSLTTAARSKHLHLGPRETGADPVLNKSGGGGGVMCPQHVRFSAGCSTFKFVSVALDLLSNA